MSIDHGNRRLWLAAALSIVLLATVLWAPRGLATPGDSDETFSGDGIVDGEDGASHGVGEYDDFAIQPDGKIVLMSTVFSKSFLAFGTRVARINADGSFDTSFGSDEMAGSDVPTQRSLALQPDGKVLIASATGSNFDLTRLNSDGSYDSTFSGDGKAKVAVPLAGDATVTDLALLGDGRFVIGGRLAKNAMLARFTADGALDPSFSGDGIATTSVGGESSISKIAPQPGGSIVAVGSSMERMLVARYTTAGDLDPTFSGDGLISDAAAGSATGVVVDGSGRIAVSGAGVSGIEGTIDPASEFTVVRYTSAGERDQTFGAGGLAKVSFGDPSVSNGLAAAADESLVLVGAVDHSRSGWREEDFAVAMIDASGNLDQAFSGDGKRVQDLRCGGNERLLSAGVDPTGRIVTVGDCKVKLNGFSDTLATVARYEASTGPADEDADGVLDQTDRCPDAFDQAGEGQNRGCPNVGRKVKWFTLKNGFATGRIEAGDAACELDQKVSLVEVRRGPDRVVAHGRTDPDLGRELRRRDAVAFKLKGPKGGGSYRAVVGQRFEPVGGICAAAQSKVRKVK